MAEAAASEKGISADKEVGGGLLLPNCIRLGALMC